MAGYSRAGRFANAALIAAGYVGLAVVGVAVHQLSETLLHIPVSVLVVAGGVAAWVVIAAAVTAIRFRPSAVLKFVRGPVAVDRTSKGDYHCFQVRNKSRGTVRGCIVRIESIIPADPLKPAKRFPLPLPLPCSPDGKPDDPPVDVHDDQTLAFDLCATGGAGSSICWGYWKDRYWSEAGGYDVVVALYAVDVAADRVVVRVRPAGQGWDVVCDNLT